VAATTTGAAATVDNDGGANGIVGLGTAPAVQLDLPNFGSPAATAYNSTRNSFVTVGTESTRDWTVLDWGSPTADTVVWDLYGSGDPSGPQPDRRLPTRPPTCCLTVACPPTSVASA
jgi:hypothetical protein